MSFHLGDDKLVDLAAAAELVPVGAVVALGGGLSARLPMALVRQLVRRHVTGLHVVGSAHSIDVDMLAAAGAIGVCEESYVGYEQDFGLAPAFRRAVEEGSLEARETCCHTVLTQLRASEMGLPFLPVRGIKGTDILGLHPEYGEVTCPFTGETLVAVPALTPDVALVHAPMGDRAGNLHLEQPYVLDERFAAASEAVVATVDLVASTEEVASAGIVIPAHRVAAVVEAPFGAHPASSFPGYAYDRAHIAEWVEAAGSAEGAARYLDTYVRGVDEAGYRDLVGVEHLARLSAHRGSTDEWMELYR
jgi:glutaconate CoA-transferase subunit A